jgi:hypothetical protein
MCEQFSNAPLPKYDIFLIFTVNKLLQFSNAKSSMLLIYGIIALTN